MADPILLIGHTTLPPLLAGTLTLLADSIWTSSTPQRTELTTALPSALALHRMALQRTWRTYGGSFGYVFLDAAPIAQEGGAGCFTLTMRGMPHLRIHLRSLPPLCFSSFFLSCISRFR